MHTRPVWGSTGQHWIEAHDAKPVQVRKRKWYHVYASTVENMHDMVTANNYHKMIIPNN